MSNVSRAYAKVMRSAVLWGLAATAAFYVMIAGGVAGPLLGEGAQSFLARYCAGHLIEYVEVTMFFIGMAALLIKRRDIVEQFAGLKESILGPVPPGGQSADDCDSLVARLDAAPAHQQQSYLIRRLRDAMACVRRNGSAENLDQELKYLAETDDGRAHSGFGLVRVIIWAIPILGFLGTVIGITDAIAGLDPRNLETSLNEVVGSLAVAFDTTALALTLSIVMMFTQFAIDRSEQRLLGRVEVQVGHELSSRFLQTKTGGHPEVAAVRRMADALLESSGELVQRQAELWKATIDEAHQEWSGSLASAHGQVESALGQAMAHSLDAHARQVAEAGQTLARQNHEHWTRVQQAMSQNAQLMSKQQECLIQQGQVLREVLESAGQVSRLEDVLNRNLAALSGSHDFEETLESLAAVIHLLNARLSRSGANLSDPDATGGRAA